MPFFLKIRLYFLLGLLTLISLQITSSQVWGIGVSSKNVSELDPSIPLDHQEYLQSEIFYNVHFRKRVKYEGDPLGTVRDVYSLKVPWRLDENDDLNLIQSPSKVLLHNFRILAKELLPKIEGFNFHSSKALNTPKPSEPSNPSETSDLSNAPNPSTIPSGTYDLLLPFSKWSGFVRRIHQVFSKIKFYKKGRMIKIPSHNTYFFWPEDHYPFHLVTKENAENNPSDPNVIKGSETINEASGKSLGPVFYLKRATVHDGPVHSLLLELIHNELKPLTVRFLPEYGPFLSRLNVPDKLDSIKPIEAQLYDTYILRKIEPIGPPMGGAPFPADKKTSLHPYKILALHGFLDPEAPWLTEAAQAAGLSKAEWVDQIFLPKFAEFQAASHYQIGLFHHSHTQNLVVFLNTQNGDIEFVYRDMQDIYWESFIAEQFDSAIPEVLLKFDIDQLVSTSRLAEENKTEKRASAGFLFALYSYQTLEALSVDKFQGRNRLLKFLQHYFEEIFKITGFDLLEDPTLKRYLLHYRAHIQNNVLPYKIVFSKDPDKVLRGSRAFIKILMDKVHERVIAHKLAQLRLRTPDDRLTPLNKNQRLKALLSVSRFLHILDPEVGPNLDPLLENEDEESYDLEILGTQILLFDAKTNKPAAITQDLRPYMSEIEEILKSDENSCAESLDPKSG